MAIHKNNLICTGPEELKPELSQFRSLKFVRACTWLILCICTIASQTKDRSCNCTFFAKNMHCNFWVVKESFAFPQAHLAAACMVRAWSVFAVHRQGEWVSAFWTQRAVCWVGFMPTDAHSSWRGLLMTCTSLEQHGDCCDWQGGEGGTTPKNLTEPLWQRADRWKQQEQDREMREERGES